MIDSIVMTKNLKKIISFLFAAIFIILMFVVAYQQAQIHVLGDRAEQHDAYIEFMQKGERFTFLDGQALFYICTDGRAVSEEMKQSTWDLYLQRETAFSEWLRLQDKCQSK